MIESWRKCWREGVAPNLSTDGLIALERGLATDDPRLLQRATTTPPMPCLFDWPCEAADAIGYAGWQGDGLETIGEIEQFFSEVCARADNLLGEPAGVRWYLNAYDDWPRAEMIRRLLPEVQRSLAIRSGECPPEEHAA